MITVTFTITLDRHFLSMQLIYAGKTKQRLSKVQFPSSFSLSFNPKHYSNEEEPVKVLNYIVIPYVSKEKEKLGLNEGQAMLQIINVFKGQTVDPVLKVLSNNNIFLQSVPANITYLFQLLDVQGGANGFVKHLIKNKFSDWYAVQITQAMDDSRELDSIDIELKLSIIKPLHAKRMMEVYNEMTSAERKEVCLKGWEVSDIKGATELGVTKLLNLDPLDDFDSMLEEDCNDIPVIDSSAILRAVSYIPSDHEIRCGNDDDDDDDDDDDGDEEEWIDEQNERNVFTFSFDNEEGF